ncbi:MAG: hypothetical protein M1820_002557 [Bogoriella megaspora]|nr:MAG: hypothetical protein M1820_002557 [Bogoriella megaspora]
MCLIIPSGGRTKYSSDHPEAYRIHHSRDTGPGSHRRRYSIVGRHPYRKIVPEIKVSYQDKRCPHIYRSSYNYFPAALDYYEFPTRAYPYKRQNAKGKVRGVRSAAGFTRTVADRDREIYGVRYHTERSKTDFYKTEVVYPPWYYKTEVVSPYSDYCERYGVIV